jgi:tetratricopeptide (TPR) repeat protein
MSNSRQMPTADVTSAGRNDPCPCGSGRKYKRCCGRASADPGKIGPDTAPPRPSLGPVTEAGRLLAAYSPLRQAILQAQHRPSRNTDSAAPADKSRRTQSAQAHLNLAARHEAAGRLPDAIAALQTAAHLLPHDAVAHYNLGLTCLKANRLPEAVASLQQATMLQPDFGRAHYNLGVALHRQGHDTAAIEALRAAIGLKARVAEATARLGDLLQARGDLVEAAACFRRASDGTVAGRLNAAKALAVEEKYEDAAAVLRRLLALEPNNAVASWLLGFYLAIQGRFDEALPQLEHACALEPEAVGAFHNLVLAKHINEADRPLLARMTAVLESGRLHDVARVTTHYALGKAFDDLRDYPSAIRHFDAANSIENGLSVYDRGQLAAWVDLLIARCTRNYFREHAALGTADKRAVFIVGMPRSGTTLVEQILSSHPLVVAGGEREFWLRRGPAWEHSQSEGLNPAVINGLADDYRAELLRIAPNAARVTDKMPHNFMWIGLIHLVFPQARIIHCRRHPVDTCLSIYFTQFMRRMNFASDRSNLVFEYRQYQRLMEHWRSVLPPDRFVEVDYEAQVADRESWARRLVEFCGLDWHDACLHPERNRRAVTTASLWQARQPVYRSSVARWRCYEPWLGELRDLLPPEDRG